jgi:hypothetical protein
MKRKLGRWLLMGFLITFGYRILLSSPGGVYA